MSSSIYLDHIASTPLEPRVLEVMLPALTEMYGNPSAQFYAQGRLAARAIAEARGQVAQLVGAPEEAVIFTSGATESNNLAILGKAETRGSGHLVVGSVEHFSILGALDPLRNRGFEVTLLPVDSHGRVPAEAVARALRPDTFLVSLATANPEIGTIQEIGEIGALCRERGVAFHTDAAAAAGLTPIDLERHRLDMVTLSAHNMYGPKGVGALVVRPGIRLHRRSFGGLQEAGLRAGTENVPGIVGFGEAARLARLERDERTRKLRHLGRLLWQGLEERVDYIHFTGHPEARLPGHVSFWVEFAEGESILMFLSLKGIMAASGSACASNIQAEDEEDLVASHVLTAIGVPDDICAGSITMSLGKDNTEEEVGRVLEELPAIVQRLWAMSPAYADHLKSKGDSHE